MACGGPRPPTRRRRRARPGARADVADALRRASDLPRMRWDDPTRSSLGRFPPRTASGPSRLAEERFHTQSVAFPWPDSFRRAFRWWRRLQSARRERRRTRNAAVCRTTRPRGGRGAPTDLADPEAHTANSNAHTSREDVRVLERWLDTRVADAARMSEPNGETAPARRRTRRDRGHAPRAHRRFNHHHHHPVTLKVTPKGDPKAYVKAARETCDAAIDVFRATFETIARDVFTEAGTAPRPAARLGLQRTLRVEAPPPRRPHSHSDVVARAARVSSRRSRARPRRSRSLRVADARARARRRPAQLDTSRAQILVDTETADVAHASAMRAALPRGRAAAKTHRERRSQRHAKRRTCETLGGCVGVAFDRPRLARAAERGATRDAVAARAVGAGAACDAAARSRFRNRGVGDGGVRRSKQAEAFVFSKQARAVEASPRWSATRRLKTRRRTPSRRRVGNARRPPRGDPGARRAGRRAVRLARRGRIRETRSERWRARGAS